jgi:hypothetical protein
MDQQKVELYEKKRWRMRLRFVIVMSACMSVVLLWLSGLDLTSRAEFGIPIALLMFVGIFWAAFSHDKIENKIKRDPALNRALNGEMYRANNAKATSNGFKAMMFSAAIFFIFGSGIEKFVDSPLKFGAFIIIFLGAMTHQISWLVYNK